MRAFGVLIGVMIVGGAAQAAAPGEAELLTCAAKTAPAERLACYDNAVAGISAEARRLSTQREADARAIATAEAAAAAKLAADAAAKQEADKLAAFGRDSMKAKDRPPEAIASLDMLEAKIAETLSTADGKLVFILDNGQMWRQTEGFQLPPVKVGYDVVVKKGFMGSFSLTVTKIGRTVKVVRMR